MTPVELAAAVYEREECARTFREDLEAHLFNGYVYSTPTMFIMGRPVRHDAPREELVNPWFVFPRAEWDAWMVYLAAGNLAEFWRVEPFPLEFVIFERQNVIRCFYAKHVKRLCSSKPLLFSSSSPGLSTLSRRK
jgi:hypothetical protein